MLSCFQDPIDGDKLDRSPFGFRHNLMGHPALDLSSLAKSLPALPSHQVTYSKSLLAVGADFESTFRGRAQPSKTINRRSAGIDSWHVDRLAPCGPRRLA